MKKCYVCDAHISEEEAERVAEKIDKIIEIDNDEAFDEFLTEQLGLVHCQGGDEYFLEEDGRVIICQECLDNVCHDYKWKDLDDENLNPAF